MLFCLLRNGLVSIVPTIENGGTLYSGVLVFFLFLFSTQNQVPKMMIGLGWVIYHIKALSVVIRLFNSVSVMIPILPIPHLMSHLSDLLTCIPDLVLCLLNLVMCLPDLVMCLLNLVMCLPDLVMCVPDLVTWGSGLVMTDPGLIRPERWQENQTCAGLRQLCPCVK